MLFVERKGDFFQIWEPDAQRSHEAIAEVLRLRVRRLREQGRSDQEYLEKEERRRLLKCMHQAWLSREPWQKLDEIWQCTETKDQYLRTLKSN